MLPKLPFRGVYFLRRGQSYIVQFHRKGYNDKQIRLSSSTPGAAYKEAYDLGLKFDLKQFDPWKDRVDEVTLKDAIAEYLEKCSEMSPYTYRERKILLGALQEWIPGHTLMGRVRARDLQAFLNDPRTSKKPDGTIEIYRLAPSTKKGYYAKLNAFLNWCVRMRYLQDNPLKEMDVPKDQKRLPVFLTPTQFEEIVEFIEKKYEQTPGLNEKYVIWMADVVRFAAFTGLRLQEITHLRWQDVDLDGGIIYVRSYRSSDISFTTKSKHDRAVPIFSGTRQVLMRQQLRLNGDKENAGLVFRSAEGRMLYPNYVSKVFRSVREDLNLPSEIHFHTLRHTFASWAVSAGVPIRVVQAWMGHSSVRQTEIYAHLSPDAAHRKDVSIFKKYFEP